jgi:hypothetical protein
MTLLKAHRADPAGGPAFDRPVFMQTVLMIYGRGWPPPNARTGFRSDLGGGEGRGLVGRKRVLDSARVNYDPVATMDSSP